MAAVMVVVARAGRRRETAAAPTMAGWAAATEASARSSADLGTHVAHAGGEHRHPCMGQASVRPREHTFRRDDELEEEDAEEEDAGCKPAAGQATQHCGTAQRLWARRNRRNWPIRGTSAASIGDGAVAHPQEGLAKSRTQFSSF